MTLDQYKAEYAQALAQQGVKVVFNEDGDPNGVPDVGGYKNPDNWVATLSRDGVSVDTLVTLGRIQVTGFTPEQMAQQDITFALKYKAQRESPQGQLPSTWFVGEDDDTRRFYEVYPERRPGYTAGPPPTVNSHRSTQPAQAPEQPNAGTRVTQPTSNVASNVVSLSFWAWNYYYEQQTGRSGPSPEEVGVASGTQVMTGEEWARAVGNWYGTPATIPAVTGGSSATVGGNPTTPAIPVGTGGVGVGGGGGGAPVVTPTPPPANPVAGPRRETFWTWNALKEQQSSIVGPDPAMYSIHGDDYMTLPEWEALTAGYYATAKAPVNGSNDNTMLYVLAGLAALLLLGNRG